MNESVEIYSRRYSKYHDCEDNKAFNLRASREIEGAKASDICFGDVTTDVVCIYCPRCLTIIDCFDY
jgi:hypothetical protein